MLYEQFSQGPDVIGDIPFVMFRRVVPENCAKVSIKLEGRNPTGSIKDRMALAVIRGSLVSGQLSPMWPQIEMVRLLGPGSAVATISGDTGLKYLSTDVYSYA